MTEITSTVHNPNNCVDVFPWDNHCALAYRRNALCIVPALLHKMLKRHLFKGWGFMRLIIFTASSMACLSETAF